MYLTPEMSGGFPNRREVMTLVLAGVLAGSLVRPALAEDQMPVVFVERVRASLLEDKQVTSEILRMRMIDGTSVLRARKGMPFQVVFVNTLDEEIVLQFFGVRGPDAAMRVVLPAKTSPIDTSVLVSFTPPDAGTFWIGPAQDAHRLRDLGLSALFIVGEEAPTGPAGMTDVALILDDWMIDEKGTLDQDYGNLERLISTGRFGNWLTVNAQFKPRFAVPRDVPVWLRLFNAANMRVMKLSLTGADPVILALDGQPLNTVEPLRADAIVLAPGQRIDLKLTSLTSLATLRADLGADTVEIAFLETYGAVELIKRLEIIKLAPNPVAQPAAEVRTIPITLEGGAQGGLAMAQVGIEKLELRQMLERGLAWAINGISGPGGPVLFVAKRGETLALEIENRTNFDQVICVLGHAWTMMELGGVARDNPSLGDTAVIPAKSKAKMLMVADNPGLWAIQSTQADRADGGLYATFAVEAELP
jgi:FtsP/CotA-like multicopper oxidase with cupredoxin domain